VDFIGPRAQERSRLGLLPRTSQTAVFQQLEHPEDELVTMSY